LIREELCREAIRLTDLLSRHPAGNRPRTHALLALMFLNSARAPARMDSAGNILRLQEQDRSRWDKSMIARGMFHLTQSASGSEISEYHLQASIAACHCAARDFKETDWPQIDNSPVVALNRAVAVANVHGPAAGIAAVSSIRSSKELRSYYLLHAVLGDFEARLDRPQAAAAHFRKALKQTEIASEVQFLSKRLEECEAALVSQA
jgi:RNA polymerase sigma-70 factor (ECF subfamily)